MQLALQSCTFSLLLARRIIAEEVHGTGLEGYQCFDLLCSCTRAPCLQIEHLIIDAWL